MKVAVLMSGLVRTIAHTWPLMRRSFIDHHQADVFIYLNEPEKEQAISQLLQPKAMLVEPDPQLPEPDCHTRLGPGCRAIQNDLRQLHGMKKVNQLRKQSNEKYDWVIRIRPDVEIVGGLESLESLAPSSIYVPRFDNWYGCSDRFAVGPLGLMDIYMERDEAFNDYFRLGGIFHMEIFLAYHLRRHNVPLARTNIVFNLLRENGQHELPWWGPKCGDVPFPPDALAAMKAAACAARERDASTMLSPGAYWNCPIFNQGTLSSGAHEIAFGDPCPPMPPRWGPQNAPVRQLSFSL